MKRKVNATAGAMVVAGGIGLAFAQSGVVNADPDLSRADIEEQVKARYPGEITELELEKEKNRATYEVEVMVEGKEYDLTIDGDSGEVLKLEEKVKAAEDSSNKQGDDHGDNTTQKSDDKSEDDTSKKSDNQDDEPYRKTDDTSDDNTTQKPDDNPKTDDNRDDNKPNNSGSATASEKENAMIGMQEAEKIAMDNFSGTVVEKELEEDDGRQIYKFEIVNGNREAEIEIDAFTGDLLVLEIETEED